MNNGQVSKAVTEADARIETYEQLHDILSH